MDIDWLEEHIMAPLEHLFNDHKLCDSNWCPVKMKEKSVASESTIDTPDNTITNDVPDVMIDYCLASCDNGDIKDCDTQDIIGVR